MSQVSCRMKNGVWFPSTIQPSALETFIYALQLRIMHLSLPLLVSFLALFEHVVRLPSQCSKTAVRCELYVIKIWCRLGKFRDAAHPHVLIICCCGITWVRPPCIRGQPKPTRVYRLRGSCCLARRSHQWARHWMEISLPERERSTTDLLYSVFRENTWDTNHILM